MNDSTAYGDGSALQPHKGSSESGLTMGELDKNTLQPHKGSSERITSTFVTSKPTSLQPHKGSSERDEFTALADQSDAASTPQGFV